MKLQTLVKLQTLDYLNPQCVLMDLSLEGGVLCASLDPKDDSTIDDLIKDNLGWD